MKKIFLLIFFVFGYIFVRINTTDSLPQTLFIKTKKENIEKGDYVAFCHPMYQQKLVKRVAGEEGSDLSIQKGELFVDGKNIGGIRKTSRSGNSITPIQWKKIPEGYLFVEGDHPESYDSRYEEFGLVKKEDILEVLWPIF